MSGTAPQSLGGRLSFAKRMIDSELPYDLRLQAEREIAFGERLLWMGRPRARRSWWQCWPIVLFGIPWTAAALVWTLMAASVGGIASLLSLFGLPFVAIGVGALLAPLWILRSAARTVYAVTDRRLLVLTFGRTLRSVSIGRGQWDMKRTERRDGSGDLELVERHSASEESPRTVHLWSIPEVRTVERLLREHLLAPAPERDVPVAP
jgi:hypothetical protein